MILDQNECKVELTMTVPSPPPGQVAPIANIGSEGQEVTLKGTGQRSMPENGIQYRVTKFLALEPPIHIMRNYPVVQHGESLTSDPANYLFSSSSTGESKMGRSPVQIRQHQHDPPPHLVVPADAHSFLGHGSLESVTSSHSDGHKVPAPNSSIRAAHKSEIWQDPYNGTSELSMFADFCSGITYSPSRQGMPHS